MANTRVTIQGPNGKSSSLNEARAMTYEGMARMFRLHAKRYGDTNMGQAQADLDQAALHLENVVRLLRAK